MDLVNTTLRLSIYLFIVFREIRLAGSINEMCDGSDLVIDATGSSAPELSAGGAISGIIDVVHITV